MTKEDVISIIESGSQDYIDLVNATLYAKRADGSRDTSFIDAMKKWIFDEAQGIETEFTLREEAALEKNLVVAEGHNASVAENFATLLKITGEAQISPFQFFTLTLKDAIGHGGEYMRLINDAKEAGWRKQYQTVFVRADEAMAAHKQMLAEFIDARNTLQPILDLLKGSDVAQNNITIEQRALDEVLSTVESIPKFLEDKEYLENRGKIDYYKKNLKPAEMNVIQESNRTFDGCCEMLEERNIQSAGLSEAITKLKQSGQAGGTGEALTFMTNDETYRDTIAKLQTIYERLEATRKTANAVSQDIEPFASGSGHSEKMRRTAAHIGKGCTLITDAVEGYMQTLGRVMKRMEENYDGIDITYSETIRLRDNLDKVIAAMSKRQEAWDKKHPQKDAAKSLV